MVGMATRWVLIAEAWSLNEIAHKVEGALTVLTLLKFKRLKITVSEDEGELRRRVLEVRSVLQNLLKEIQWSIKSGHVLSPLIKALQKEYGYADLRRVKEKLESALSALKRISSGEYRDSDFEELERALECIAYEASSRSQELITRAGRY